jgi:hypothetical protein
MTDTPTPSSRLGAKDLIALIASIIGSGFLISGAIRSDGQREQRLVVVEEKIGKLESSTDRRADLLNAIDVRTARIEATLTMMTKSAVK